jgi:hypothetical protein
MPPAVGRCSRSSPPAPIVPARNLPPPWPGCGGATRSPRRAPTASPAHSPTCSTWSKPARQGGAFSHARRPDRHGRPQRRARPADARRRGRVRTQPHSRANQGRFARRTGLGSSVFRDSLRRARRGRAAGVDGHPCTTRRSGFPAQYRTFPEQQRSFRSNLDVIGAKPGARRCSMIEGEQIRWRKSAAVTATGIGMKANVTQVARGFAPLTSGRVNSLRQIDVPSGTMRRVTPTPDRALCPALNAATDFAAGWSRGGAGPPSLPRRRTCDPAQLTGRRGRQLGPAEQPVRPAHPYPTPPAAAPAPRPFPPRRGLALCCALPCPAVGRQRCSADGLQFSGNRDCPKSGAIAVAAMSHGFGACLDIEGACAAPPCVQCPHLGA